MRLIDVDALKSRIERMWKSRQLTNTKYKTFIELLDAEPTIEPERKRGNWAGAQAYCKHLEEKTGEGYVPSGIGNVRLIDADVLYEKAASLEALALNEIKKIMERDGHEVSTEWRIWSAILAERTAFKHDVFDAPTIETEPYEEGTDD